MSLLYTFWEELLLGYVSSWLCIFEIGAFNVSILVYSELVNRVLGGNFISA